MSKILSVGIFVVLVGLAFFLGQQTERRNTDLRLEQLQAGNTQQSREEAKRVVRQVRRIMVIDEEIEPTVATIVDVEALRERNPFYAKADNGDHLIITSDRAILYDPDSKKIIDIVPVNIQQQSGPPAQQPLEEEPAQEESVEDGAVGTEEEG